MKHYSYITLVMLQLCLSTYAITESNSSLMRLLRSPQFKKMVRGMVGESIYDRFIKRKTAQENEKLALEQNPYPWEKFLEKPSYWQHTQNWLYHKSRGALGKQMPTRFTASANYQYPSTKEGQRAELLHTLYIEDARNYKQQWLNENKYGDFWLQAPSNLLKNEQKPIEKPQSKPLLKN